MKGISMSLYKEFETNQAAEVEGKFVEYGANDDGSIPAFKLARMSKVNKRYTKALERATRPHRRAIEMETMNNELAERLFREVFVDTVLLDWRNVQDREGKKLAFNRENALKLLTDLPELYDDLQEKAKKASLFRDDASEKEAGN
jgi:hypothetical protein